MKTKKLPPRTDAEWAAYRCQQSCKLGREALDKESVKNGASVLAYAVFNLLHAVEDLSKQIVLLQPAKPKKK